MKFNYRCLIVALMALSFSNIVFALETGEQPFCEKCYLENPAYKAQIDEQRAAANANQNTNATNVNAGEPAASPSAD